MWARGLAAIIPIKEAKHLQPRADITRSPKQSCICCPTKRTNVLETCFFFNKLHFRCRYNALLSSREQQKRWVRDYTDELIQLQRDVDNVRRINETIPRTCFGTITLEPTDPTG